MPLPSRRLVTEVLRRDLVAFIQRSLQTVAPGAPYQHNWHIDVIAWHLEQCLNGPIKRLIITLPPRSLKSHCVSVAFPAWVLGHVPASRIICASYSSELAIKHARDCRAVIESGWYRRVFPNTRLDPGKSAELELATLSRGFRLSTSVGGTLTGRGGNLIIIDDPLKAADAMSDVRREAVDDWFRSTLYSRLDDKAHDRIIVVMQRLHVDDLAGCLLRTSSDWVHLNLPAIAEVAERFKLGAGTVVRRKPGQALHPERESLKTLEQIRRTIGSYEFAAQYQQNPIPAEGGLIKSSWFRPYDVAPPRQPGAFVTQSWDTASKATELSDYSVCSTWLCQGSEHYLLDVFRDRLEYPALKRQIVKLFRRHQPDAVLIEDKGSGIQLIQDLSVEGVVRPMSITPETDKVTRMYTQTAKIEAGGVLLPRSAAWLDDFRAEVLQFPHGRYDDQIDSMSQYLGWEGSSRWAEAPAVVIGSRVAAEWPTNFESPGSFAF
jgi:predicted phage terminase large subunit-like protein